MGFVTLTFTNIDIPPECGSAKQLKNPVPALLLAKMGVSKKYQGHGYGKDLLTYAVKQASETSNEVGGVGLVIDAKDEKAKAFYHGREWWLHVKPGGGCTLKQGGVWMVMGANMQELTKKTRQQLAKILSLAKPCIIFATHVKLVQTHKLSPNLLEIPQPLF